MVEDNYAAFAGRNYLEMWGINPDEKIHFYYDESNNCRKFWLDHEKGDFNSNYTDDFVLAGIATENDFQIPFEELKNRFKLQDNVKELKTKTLFKGKDFLECMNSKYVSVYIDLFTDYNLYMHYVHVNNFFYTIVEIIDSIIELKEITDWGFDYFKIKSIFYNMLCPNIKDVVDVMITYSYPNIKTDHISDFCNGIINAISFRIDQTPEEKFITGMLKRASERNELIFIQNNIDYVTQEDYSIFYAELILKFSKSMHHFDEELSIQDEIINTVNKLGNGQHNYEFIKSDKNTMIQISDLTAGLLGKMFSFINNISTAQIRKIVSSLSDTQVKNCVAFNDLRIKSNNRNPGFLHSITAIDICARIDDFFNRVSVEYKNRKF